MLVKWHQLNMVRGTSWNLWIVKNIKCFMSYFSSFVIKVGKPWKNWKSAIQVVFHHWPIDWESHQLKVLNLLGNKICCLQQEPSDSSAVTSCNSVCVLKLVWTVSLFVFVVWLFPGCKNLFKTAYLCNSLKH